MNQLTPPLNLKLDFSCSTVNPITLSLRDVPNAPDAWRFAESNLC